MLVAVIGSWLVADLGNAQAAGPSYAIAMHGAPALPADFTQMPYVNPDAPKGGRLTQSILGSFDSLNPLIVKGIALQQIRGYVIESLMARGNDEPFTLYGLLADSIETDEARTYATFHLNPQARFSDGQPVLAEDVLFSWQLLRDKGRPNHRQYYSKVAKAEALDARTVRFDFGGTGDRELPLILGLMPILPKHAVDVATFEETSMMPPIGSGPYRVTSVKPGTSIVMTRDPNYWGRNLPINRGLWNFDEVRFDFYRDANSQFEAFKRGLYDFRVETEPLRWHDGYNFPAAKGHLVREAIKTGLPKSTEFLVFNTRRPIFSDIRVREALTLLFDFEWINRNYFFGLYSRSGGQNAERMKALDDDELSIAVERQMHSILGRVHVEPGRNMFPLAIEQPEQVAKNRIVLIGEAAHVLPPIGAQGLNMGLRDAADIAEIVHDAMRSKQDAGAPAVMTRFELARRADIHSRTVAIDIANRSLLSDFLPLQVARAAGLHMIGSVGPLRRLAMREGLAPSWRRAPH